MSSFWNFVFGAILIIIWVLAGGFVTTANINLTNYRNLDLQLHQAYWFTFWAAFVTWFLVALFIILVILAVIGVVGLFSTGVGEAGLAAEGVEGGLAASEEFTTLSKGQDLLKYKDSQGISWATIGFLIFAFILVSVTGVLSAIAADEMVKSSNYKNTDNKLVVAYRDCIISASMCIGAAGILIIGMITYYIVGYQRQKKIEAENKLIEKERRLQLAQIKELQQKSAVQKLQEQSEFKQKLQKAAQDVIIQKITAQTTSSSDLKQLAITEGSNQVYKQLGISQ